MVFVCQIIFIDLYMLNYAFIPWMKLPLPWYMMFYIGLGCRFENILWRTFATTFSGDIGIILCACVYVVCVYLCFCVYVFLSSFGIKVTLTCVVMPLPFYLWKILRSISVSPELLLAMALLNLCLISLIFVDPLALLISSKLKFWQTIYA